MPTDFSTAAVVHDGNVAETSLRKNAIAARNPSEPGIYATISNEARTKRLRQMDCGLQSLEEVVSKRPARGRLLGSKLGCIGPAVQIPTSDIAESPSRSSMMMSLVDHPRFARL